MRILSWGKLVLALFVVSLSLSFNVFAQSGQPDDSTVGLAPRAEEA
jgi:hypothetical protein